MKDCAYFGTQISGYLDGMLSQAETEALQAHLEHCPECRALWESFRDISEAFDTLETAPPARFSEAVLAAVKEQAAEAKRKRRCITSVAAALIILLLGLCSLQAVKCFSAAHRKASAGEDTASAKLSQSSLEACDAAEGAVAAGSAAEKSTIRHKSNVIQSMYRIDRALTDAAEETADETGETDGVPAFYFAILTIRGNGENTLLTRAETDALLAQLDASAIPYRYQTDGPGISNASETCRVCYVAELPQGTGL